MTNDHCCGADKLFDLKGARKELKRYLNKGPRNTTRRLLSHLKHYNKQDKSLLDIGGGIGVIQWDFLSHMGARTTDVDAAGAYLQVAKEYAADHNWEDKCTFIQGDFSEVGEGIDVHDFVTLDRVICCYPDYISLLKMAMEKCGSVLALSYPMSGSLAQVVSELTGVYLYLKRNPFRTYVHPSAAVESFITNHGFKLRSKSLSFPWHVQVYERS